MREAHCGSSTGERQPGCARATRARIGLPRSPSAVSIREFPSMNKAELIDAVAEVAELTKADAGRAVDAVIAAITKALKKGDTVTVVGFGTFAVRKRAAREGRNPRTGETIKVAASMNPEFKAGKALKDAVN
jgi:DNA-binding protein HU-beta